MSYTGNNTKYEDITNENRIFTGWHWETWLCMEKTKTGSLFNTTHKDELQRWIKELNVKSEIIKVIEKI